MTVRKPKRMGPKMRRAIAIVESNPGCVMYTVAKRLHIACAKGKNNALGYDPVHRAIKAGYITLVQGKLYRTDKELLP